MVEIEKIRREKPIKDLLQFSIINIDKPTGPTSFTISNYIAKTLSMNKTSHFVTLNPMSSGVLQVALGRECRLNKYFIHKNKTYVGIMRLHNLVPEEILNKVKKDFTGKIKQLPPVR